MNIFEYTVDEINQCTSELYHYGVPGMKWGRRKARPVSTGSGARGSGARPGSNAQVKAEQVKQARKAKAKRALKIGAAAAGTALAAYGVWKMTALNREYNKTQKELRKRVAAKSAELARKAATSNANPWDNIAYNSWKTYGDKIKSQTITDAAGRVVFRK